MKFYRCTNCDQVYMKLLDQKKEMSCCEVCTEEIQENTTPEDLDAHKPNIRKIGNFVTISLENHPMVDIHYIEFICMETNQGFQFKKIALDTPPKVDFILAKDEDIKTVYIYCNLHSLWKY